MSCIVSASESPYGAFLYLGAVHELRQRCALKKGILQRGHRDTGVPEASVAIGHDDDAAAASGLHCRAHRCECKHDPCSIPGREREERNSSLMLQGTKAGKGPLQPNLSVHVSISGPKLDCALVSS